MGNPGYRRQGGHTFQADDLAIQATAGAKFVEGRAGTARTVSSVVSFTVVRGRSSSSQASL